MVFRMKREKRECHKIQFLSMGLEIAIIFTVTRYHGRRLISLMEGPKCYRSLRVIDKNASRYAIYKEALFLS